MDSNESGGYEVRVQITLTSYNALLDTIKKLQQQLAAKDKVVQRLLNQSSQFYD